MFKLSEIENYSLEKVKEISEKLNSADEFPEYKLDCEDVFGLDHEKWDALFSQIRPEWKQEVNGYYRELDNFMTKLNGDLLEDVKAYLTNKHKEEYSPNFNFLNTPDLLKLATQAESYYQDDPKTSIILCRQFVELLAKYVSAKVKIYDEIKNQNLSIIINTLRNKNGIGHKIYNLLNDVKNMANQVVHPEPEHATGIDSNRPNITSKTALKFIMKIHELAIWYHKAYCRKPNTSFAPPIYDKNKIIKVQNETIDPADGDEDLTIMGTGSPKTYKPRDAEEGTHLTDGGSGEGNSQTELLTIGTVIRQRYEIKKQLSSGSFGTTYIAEDLGKPTKPFCVVKQFTPKKTDRGTFSRAVQLFQQEAGILERLGSHSEIPTMIEYFEEDDNLFLTQDYIEGNTLREEFRDENRRYKEYEVIQLLKDILTPLKFVHENNIIHRDIKPENLIRRVSDNKIVIIDFGAVKEIFEDTQQQGTTIGTVGYMPPEQSRGDTVSLTFDVYAVGMIAIEAFTGEKAKNIASPRNAIRRIKNISDGFKEILFNMTALDYEDRYKDAQEVIDAIAKWENRLAPTGDDSDGTERAEEDTTTGEQETTGTENGKKLPLIGKVAIGLGIIIMGGLFIKSIPYLTKTKLAQTEITIGTIWTPEANQGLADHIEENSVPANYISFLKGDKVRVRINGDRTLSYEEAKKRIGNKQWDIAFATSPMLSIFAKSQDYTHIAKMFPGSSGYNAGLFVRQDSLLQSIDDIGKDTRVGFGSFSSASSFYMPVYDLYGKTITANVGNRGEAIIEKVKSGELDVGSAAIGDSVRPDDPELRIIHVSRTIPTSGAYASPNLSPSDQANIKALMMNAPEEIQTRANYEDGEEPDYSNFSQIVKRVEEILVCANFTRNPVLLACSGEIQTIEGTINGVSVQGDNSVLNLSANGQIYKLALPLTLTQEIFGSDRLVDIQGQNIQVKTDQQGTDISINQINQVKLL